jgi:tetratricopeptide (TPR) repeat protein
MASKKSWKEILDQRRKENFVGRHEQLRVFSDNFVGDEPAYLVYSVTGEGGVGKSTLLTQYEQLARSPSINAVVVTCDDEHLSPAAAMGYIAKKLAEYGFKHKEFDERYKTYREKRDEIEGDPKAPRGALNLVARGVTDFAIKSARTVPGVGVFAEYIDEKAAGEALAQGVDYLFSRYGDRSEIQLLREPERILSPLFVQLLNAVGDKRRLVLMFDVFERTSETLSPWLVELFKFEYGEFPGSITFVIGGRDLLDQRWTEFAQALCHVILEPFSLEETCTYLSNEGITDESLATQIHHDTGGLPVLVELLAATKPLPGQPLADISKDAVKRFLQWVPDQDRRHAALLAAVPRQFNRDVLSAAFGHDATTLFNWLSTQSFIRTNTQRGWFYHERVRELMLRYLRSATPHDLTATHARLAHYFENQQADTRLAGKAAHDSEVWRRLELERVYHRVCQNQESGSREATNAFLSSFRWRWSFSGTVVSTFQQAAQELRLKALQDRAQMCRNFYDGYSQDDHLELIASAMNLEDQGDLSTLARCVLRATKGNSYLHLGENDAALVELSEALALDDTFAWVSARRAETYRRVSRFAEAIKDFDRAIELDKSYASAIASRGATYGQIGKFAEAIKDFDRAIELNNKYIWAIARRGETYRRMDKFEEAIKDFDRAIQLDERHVSAIASRGATHRQMGSFEQAINDFNRAIELNSKYAWAIANRGETYRQIGRLSEAIKDFDDAIELKGDYVWAISSRGETYRKMGKFEKALKDFNRAIELDARYSWAILCRATLRRIIDKNSDVTEDLQYLSQITVEDAYTFYLRAVTHILRDDLHAAVNSLRESFRLRPAYRNYAMNDDLLDPVRYLPEFQALMADA